MAKYNFNLRKPKSVTETPINLVIRWENNKLVYSTNETIHPMFWETDTKKKNFQRAMETKRFPEYPEFNGRLNDIETRSKDVFRRFQNDNKRTPTVNELKDALDIEFNTVKIKKLDFFGFFENFILESKLKTNPKTNKPFSVNTITTYSNCLAHLRAFAKHKNRKLNFENIDLDFYHDFINYLTNVKKFSENTKGKIIKIIKTVLNDATERNVNKNQSFKSKRFRVMSEAVDNIYLNDKELTDIYNLDLTETPHTERIRDLFIVGCHTGLRFSDLSKISKSNIINNEIHVKTLKTNEPVVIQFNTILTEILNKYGGTFPKAISNQKMNDYLKKDICDKVDSLKINVDTAITKGGLTVTETLPKYKLVCTHTARRSFATNCFLKGVPNFIIMGVTGHKKESSFLNYIKLTSNEKAKILKMYMDKPNNEPQTQPINDNLKIVS
jgi:integrase